MSARFLPHACLQDLIDALAEGGRQVIGPTVREGAVVLAPLGEASQLPWGVWDVQAPGSYTLEEGDEERAFAWVNGPVSAKPFLFKPQETLWRASTTGDGQLEYESVVESSRQAIIGARPCDLRAMQIQDRVFLEGASVDPRYQARRKELFTVVLNCTRAAATCFCVSQGGSPRADQGFDLAMTELRGGLVVEAGSTAGERVLEALSLAEATEAQRMAVEAGVKEAADMQRKPLPAPERLAAILPTSKDHPQWDVVAERCESCGNCTKLCPTCLCHKQTYLPSLDGEGGEQVREWASCQSEAHSYVSGKNLRAERRERYRMRVTHKLVNMQKQFGVPGCVGCGRCITWCKQSIDLTENLAIIAGDPASERDHE
jgi:ferredoxin